MSKLTDTYKQLKERLNGKKEDEDRLQQDYYLTFSSPHGKRVLSHMLSELHFFDELQDDGEEIVLASYARRVLGHIGIFRAENIEGIVSQIIKYGEKAVNVKTAQIVGEEGLRRFK